jgi:hypothetical protein
MLFFLLLILDNSMLVVAWTISYGGCYADTEGYHNKCCACVYMWVSALSMNDLLRRQLNVKIRTTSPELAHASQYGLYNWNEANTRSGSFAMLSLYHEVYVSSVPMVAIL